MEEVTSRVGGRALKHREIAGLGQVRRYRIAVNRDKRNFDIGKETYINARERKENDGSRKERENIRRNYVGFLTKSLNFDKRGR